MMFSPFVFLKFVINQKANIYQILQLVIDGRIENMTKYQYFPI